MTHLINKIYNNSAKFGFLLFFGAFAISAKANKLDSLRLENKNGQNFVIHKVDKGQTLFGTLKKYGSNISEYKKANPEADVNIKIGEIIRIPYNKPIPKAKIAKVIVDKKTTEPISETDTKKAQTYKVEPGMTLFSVAKKYSLTVDRLKKMNGLTEDDINVGQILIVREGDKVYEVEANPRKNSDPKPVILEDKRAIPMEKEKPAKKVEEKLESKPNVPVFQKVEEPVTKAKVVEKEVEKPKPVIVEKVKEEPKKVIIEEPKPINNENTVAKNVIEQEGIAEGIEVESKSGKYLALHKTAPIGALIQVKNQTTSASVWVKVIGRLPNLDGDENVVIKLSPKAMSKVSPVDKKFRTKLTYSL